jgi:hypothetical protein
MTRLLPLLLLAGCKIVEPEETSTLNWTWSNLDTASNDDLASAVTALESTLELSDEAPVLATTSRLTAEQVAPLGVTRDPSLAASFVLANRIHCDPATVAEIFTHPAQAALYPELYQTYARTDAGERAAWLAGDVATLEGSIDYSASILGSTYEGHTDTKLRRLATDVYLTRSFAPEPAVFEEADKSLEQDYQLDVYWSDDGVTTLHVSSLWRQADWGLGVTSEDALMQRHLLDSMARLDEETERICAEGVP